MNTTRELLHTRAVSFQGYMRSDGFWDIEAVMSDIRNYDTIVLDRGLLPAQQPVHNIAITLTLDDHLIIQAISARMKVTPFRECIEVENNLQTMIGVALGSGWKRAIDEKLGGIKSCTHLRELLFNMATVAFQTIPVYKLQRNRQNGNADDSLKNPPYYLGKCLSWDYNGPVVERHFPIFFKKS